MHGYDDDIEYDEYEEEEDQEGVEEEEMGYEEAPQPTKEELEYLELRQRLKESIRNKMKKGNGASRNSQDSKGKLPYNDFGSFFGPSQPVIASRVIQESKSLLENPRLASRIINKASKNTPPHGAKSNNGPQSRLPKVVSEVKRKVEKLKDTRDYSFLFSDDADLPAPSKELLPQNNSVHAFEARAAHHPLKHKQSLGISGRNIGFSSEEKKPASTNGHTQSTPGFSTSQVHVRVGPSGSQMHSRPGSMGSQLMHSRPGPSGGQQMHSRSGPSGGQQMHSKPGNSGGQQLHSRTGPSGAHLHSRSGPSGNQVHSRSGPLGSHVQSRSGLSLSKANPRTSASGSQMHSRPGLSGSQMHLKQRGSNGQSGSRFASQNSSLGRKSELSSSDMHKQQSSCNRIGLGRPLAGKIVPAKAPLSSMEKKATLLATRNQLQGSQKPSSSRMIFDAKQRTEQRKAPHEPSRSQSLQRHNVPAAKSQMNKPLKRVASQGSVDDRRPKKRPMSEDEEALSMIRSMFKVDRYAGREYDEDDSDMEANFEDIMKEEKRSARIAREEDEEQLKLIEEEERQERMRKLAKKRKLGHR